MMRRGTLLIITSSSHPSEPPLPPTPPTHTHQTPAAGRSGNAGVNHGANEVSVTNHEPASKPHFVCSPHNPTPCPSPTINNMSAAVKAREGRSGWMEGEAENRRRSWRGVLSVRNVCGFLEEDLVAELKCQQTLSGSAHADRERGAWWEWGGGQGGGD